MSNRVPHIGIIAGTAEGAALCYRTLCAEAEIGASRYDARPEITLHSLPLHLYLEAIDRDDWAGVSFLLSQSASKLAQAGADFIICPNNTLHQVFGSVEPPIPWLHIATPVVGEIIAHGWNRVGILGTQTIMEGSVYVQRLQQSNIAVVIPSDDDRIRLQHIIRSELIAGLFTSQSRVFLQNIIAEMKSEGAEAVILGCTELPLIITESQSVLPLLDSTRLLARAALRHVAQTHREELPKNRSPNSFSSAHVTSSEN